MAADTETNIDIWPEVGYYFSHVCANVRMPGTPSTPGTVNLNSHIKGLVIETFYSH